MGNTAFREEIKARLFEWQYLDGQDGERNKFLTSLSENAPAFLISFLKEANPPLTDEQIDILLVNSQIEDIWMSLEESHDEERLKSFLALHFQNEAHKIQEYWEKYWKNLSLERQPNQRNDFEQNIETIQTKTTPKLVFKSAIACRIIVSAVIQNYPQISFLYLAAAKITLPEIEQKEFFFQALSALIGSYFDEKDLIAKTRIEIYIRKLLQDRMSQNPGLELATWINNCMLAKKSFFDTVENRAEIFSIITSVLAKDPSAFTQFLCFTRSDAFEKVNVTWGAPYQQALYTDTTGHQGPSIIVDMLEKIHECEPLNGEKEKLIDGEAYEFQKENAQRISEKMAEVLYESFLAQENLDWATSFLPFDELAKAKDNNYFIDLIPDIFNYCNQHNIKLIKELLLYLVNSQNNGSKYRYSQRLEEKINKGLSKLLFYSISDTGKLDKSFFRFLKSCLTVGQDQVLDYGQGASFELEDIQAITRFLATALKQAEKERKIVILDAFVENIINGKIFSDTESNYLLIQEFILTIPNLEKEVIYALLKKVPVAGQEHNSPLIKILSNIRNAAKEKKLGANYSHVLCFLAEQIGKGTVELAKLGYTQLLTPQMAWEMLSDPEVFYELAKTTRGAQLLPEIFEEAAKDRSLYATKITGSDEQKILTPIHEEVKRRMEVVTMNLLWHFLENTEKLQEILHVLFSFRRGVATQFRMAGKIDENAAISDNWDIALSGRELRNEILLILEDSLFPKDNEEEVSETRTWREKFVGAVKGTLSNTRASMRDSMRASVASIRPSVLGAPEQKAEDVELQATKEKIKRVLQRRGDFVDTQLYTEIALNIGDLSRAALALSTIQGSLEENREIAEVYPYYRWSQPGRVLKILRYSTEDEKFISNLNFFKNLFNYYYQLHQKNRLGATQWLKNSFALFLGINELQENRDRVVSLGLMKYFITHKDGLYLSDLLDIDQKISFLRFWPNTYFEEKKKLEEHLSEIISPQQIADYIDALVLPSNDAQVESEKRKAFLETYKEKNFETNILARAFTGLLTREADSTIYQQLAILRLLLDDKSLESKKIFAKQVFSSEFSQQITSFLKKCLRESIPDTGILFIQLMVEGGQFTALAKVLKEEPTLFQQIEPFIANERVLLTLSVDAYKSMLSVLSIDQRMRLAKNIFQQIFAEGKSTHSAWKNIHALSRYLLFSELKQYYNQTPVENREFKKMLAGCLLSCQETFSEENIDINLLFKQVGLNDVLTCLKALPKRAYAEAKVAVSLFLESAIQELQDPTQFSALLNDEEELFFLAVHMEGELFQVDGDKLDLIQNKVEELFLSPNILLFMQKYAVRTDSFLYSCLANWLREPQHSESIIQHYLNIILTDEYVSQPAIWAIFYNLLDMIPLEGHTPEERDASLSTIIERVVAALPAEADDEWNKKLVFLRSAISGQYISESQEIRESQHKRVFYEVRRRYSQIIVDAYKMHIDTLLHEPSRNEEGKNLQKWMMRCLKISELTQADPSMFDFVQGYFKALEDAIADVRKGKRIQNDEEYWQNLMDEAIVIKTFMSPHKIEEFLQSQNGNVAKTAEYLQTIEQIYRALKQLELQANIDAIEEREEREKTNETLNFRKKILGLVQQGKYLEASKNITTKEQKESLCRSLQDCFSDLNANLGTEEQWSTYQQRLEKPALKNKWKAAIAEEKGRIEGYKRIRAVSENFKCDVVIREAQQLFQQECEELKKDTKEINVPVEEEEEIRSELQIVPKEEEEKQRDREIAENALAVHNVYVRNQLVKDQESFFRRKIASLAEYVVAGKGDVTVANNWFYSFFAQYRPTLATKDLLRKVDIQVVNHMDVYALDTKGGKVCIARLVYNETKAKYQLEFTDERLKIRAQLSKALQEYCEVTGTLERQLENERAQQKLAKIDQKINELQQQLILLEEAKAATIDLQNGVSLFTKTREEPLEEFGYLGSYYHAESDELPELKTDNVFMHETSLRLLLTVDVTSLQGKQLEERTIPALIQDVLQENLLADLYYHTFESSAKRNKETQEVFKTCIINCLTQSNRTYSLTDDALSYLVKYHDTYALLLVMEALYQLNTDKARSQAKSIFEKLLRNKNHCEYFFEQAHQNKKDERKTQLFEWFERLQLTDLEAKKWMECDYPSEEGEPCIHHLLVAYRLNQGSSENIASLDVWRQLKIAYLPDAVLQKMQAYIRQRWFVMPEYWPTIIEKTKSGQWLSLMSGFEKKDKQLIVQNFLLGRDFLSKDIASVYPLYFEQGLTFLLRHFGKEIVIERLLKDYGLAETRSEEYKRAGARCALAICCDAELCKELCGEHMRGVSSGQNTLVLLLATNQQSFFGAVRYYLTLSQAEKEERPELLLVFQRIVTEKLHEFGKLNYQEYADLLQLITLFNSPEKKNSIKNLSAKDVLDILRFYMQNKADEVNQFIFDEAFKKALKEILIVMRRDISDFTNNDYMSLYEFADSFEKEEQDAILSIIGTSNHWIGFIARFFKNPKDDSQILLAIFNEKEENLEGFEALLIKFFTIYVGVSLDELPKDASEEEKKEAKKNEALRKKAAIIKMVNDSGVSRFFWSKVLLTPELRRIFREESLALCPLEMATYSIVSLTENNYTEASQLLSACKDFYATSIDSPAKNEQLNTLESIKKDIEFEESMQDPSFSPWYIRVRSFQHYQGNWFLWAAIKASFTSKRSTSPHNVKPANTEVEMASVSSPMHIHETTLSNKHLNLALDCRPTPSVAVTLKRNIPEFITDLTKAFEQCLQQLFPGDFDEISDIEDITQNAGKCIDKMEILIKKIKQYFPKEKQDIRDLGLLLSKINDFAQGKEISWNGAKYSLEKLNDKCRTQDEDIQEENVREAVANQKYKEAFENKLRTRFLVPLAGELREMRESSTPLILLIFSEIEERNTDELREKAGASTSSTEVKESDQILLQLENILRKLKELLWDGHTNKNKAIRGAFVEIAQFLRRIEKDSSAEAKAAREQLKHYQLLSKASSEEMRFAVAIDIWRTIFRYHFTHLVHKYSDSLDNPDKKQLSEYLSTSLNNVLKRIKGKEVKELHLMSELSSDNGKVRPMQSGSVYLNIKDGKLFYKTSFSSEAIEIRVEDFVEIGIGEEAQSIFDAMIAAPDQLLTILEPIKAQILQIVAQKQQQVAKAIELKIGATLTDSILPDLNYVIRHAFSSAHDEYDQKVLSAHKKEEQRLSALYDEDLYYRKKLQASHSVVARYPESMEARRFFKQTRDEVIDAQSGEAAKKRIAKSIFIPDSESQAKIIAQEVLQQGNGVTDRLVNLSTVPEIVMRGGISSASLNKANDAAEVANINKRAYETSELQGTPTSRACCRAAIHKVNNKKRGELENSVPTASRGTAVVAVPVRDGKTADYLVAQNVTAVDDPEKDRQALERRKMFVGADVLWSTNGVPDVLLSNAPHVLLTKEGLYVVDKQNMGYGLFPVLDAKELKALGIDVEAIEEEEGTIKDCLTQSCMDSLEQAIRAKGYDIDLVDTFEDSYVSQILDISKIIVSSDQASIMSWKNDDAITERAKTTEDSLAILFKLKKEYLKKLEKTSKNLRRKPQLGEKDIQELANAIRAYIVISMRLALLGKSSGNYTVRSIKAEDVAKKATANSVFYCFEQEGQWRYCIQLESEAHIEAKFNIPNDPESENFAETSAIMEKMRQGKKLTLQDQNMVMQWISDSATPEEGCTTIGLDLFNIVHELDKVYALAEKKNVKKAHIKEIIIPNEFFESFQSLAIDLEYLYNCEKQILENESYSGLEGIIEKELHKANVNIQFINIYNSVLKDFPGNPILQSKYQEIYQEQQNIYQQLKEWKKQLETGTLEGESVDIQLINAIPTERSVDLSKLQRTTVFLFYYKGKAQEDGSVVGEGIRYRVAAKNAETGEYELGEGKALRDDKVLRHHLEEKVKKCLQDIDPSNIFPPEQLTEEEKADIIAITSHNRDTFRSTPVLIKYLEHKIESFDQRFVQNSTGSSPIAIAQSLSSENLRGGSWLPSSPARFAKKRCPDHDSQLASILGFYAPIGIKYSATRVPQTFHQNEPIRVVNGQVPCQ